MLAQNIVGTTHYEPDFEVLRSVSTRIVCAAGTESQGEMANRGAYAVAERLGTEPVVFPSHHGGFLGGEFGQQGEPEAFAIADYMRVVSALDEQVGKVLDALDAVTAEDIQRVAGEILHSGFHLAVIGRFGDAVKPRFASARPTADVSVFSRHATVLMSPSPSRSAESGSTGCAPARAAPGCSRRQW